LDDLSKEIVSIEKQKRYLINYKI